MIIILVIVLLICTLVHAGQLPYADLEHVARAWERVGPAPAGQKTALRFALKNERREELHKMVGLVSSPSSKMYGKYLSIDDLRQRFGPSPAALDHVFGWLKSNFAHVELTLSGDFIHVEADVDEIARLFNCQVLEYRHRGSGRRVYRLDRLSDAFLPDDVHRHLDLVAGLTDFLDDKDDRKALQQRLSTDSGDASSSDNGPVITGLRGGSERTLFVGATPYCADGQKPATGGDCASGPAIKSVELRLLSDQGHENKATFAWGTAQCDSTNCAGHFNVAPWRRVFISAQTTFEDGTTSAVTQYPPFFQPTPWVTPQLVYERYGVPANARSTNPDNFQAVVGFEKQYVSNADFESFFEKMGLAPPKHSIEGPNDPSQPGVEATLDYQAIASAGRGTRTRFWSFGGPGPAHGSSYILAWAEAVANTTRAPLVTSISYGDTESDYFKKFGSNSYVVRMNDELAKMALRGLTVFAGSGDAGATNVGEGGNDIGGTNPTCDKLRPFFPSSSPYVVGVSATFLSKYSTPFCASSFNNEPVVCSTVGEAPCSVSLGIPYTTGGGFANLTAAPEYQRPAIAKYLSTVPASSLPPASWWRRDGTGYPDLSAFGWNVVLVYNKELFPVGGTSAAGPILAGLFSLINDIRLNTGRPPIGLPHPVLYQAAEQVPQAFNEIVVGDNADGDLQPRGSKYPSTCKYGFPAAPGWNPVVGLGTINFNYLVEAFEF